GDVAFEVTTTERVPPKKVEARIRQPGDLTGGVSLFQAPPEEQASAYHRLGKLRSPNGGVQKKTSGKQQKPNSNPRGPGGAVIEFDYGPYAISLGEHLRAQKNKKTGDIIISENTSEFFEWSVPSVNNGEVTLGTQPFDSNGENKRASYPCTKDGARINAPVAPSQLAYTLQVGRLTPLPSGLLLLRCRCCRRSWALSSSFRKISRMYAGHRSPTHERV
ncbi:unnamed protein product, partial [Scytosiphon promiscuus]